MDLSIYNPGTKIGKILPPPPMIPVLISFKGVNFDSSTGRCTFLLNSNYATKQRRQGEDEGDNKIIFISIYDSESNAWTRVSMTVPARIDPNGKGIYSKGKFYWVANSWEIYWDGSTSNPNRNCIVAFAVEEKVCTVFPLLEGGKVICDENLDGCDGRVM